MITLSDLPGWDADTLLLGPARPTATVRLRGRVARCLHVTPRDGRVCVCHLQTRNADVEVGFVALGRVLGCVAVTAAP